jgi:hypothetical protein
MKKFIVIIHFFIINNSFAQKEMSTTTGIINFEASVPFYAEVAATNKTVLCLLNLKNRQLTSVVQMQDFRFKLSLMEEHFNKKYLETDHYPQAIFKGTVENLTRDALDHIPSAFRLNGDLKIHGKTKKINTIVFLKKEGNGLEITSDFQVNAKDFNITIPEILSIKNDETVTIKHYFLAK